MLYVKIYKEIVQCYFRVFKHNSPVTSFYKHTNSRCYNSHCLYPFMTSNMTPTNCKMPDSEIHAEY